MIAFDTNVLIYSCDARDPERQRNATNLVATAQDGVLLWQVACEFIAASRKLAPRGFTPEQAWERLAEFLEVFPLVTPGPGVFDRAREIHLEGSSFWDAMIVAACLECGVTILYSEDLPGRAAPPGLQIINPFA
jgi:predicted nucleic acid-binding protein